MCSAPLIFSSISDFSHTTAQKVLTKNSFTKMDKAREEFLLEITSVLREFFSECDYPAELVDHTDRMIRHLMSDHVEASMPLLFPKFCKIITPNLTEDKTKQALLLGMIYHLLFSFYILRDDYIDDTNWRWGTTSWSKLHNHSKLAIIPDISILRSVFFFTLRKKFSHLPSIYIQAMHLFLDCDHKMSKGLLLEKHQLVQNLRDGKVNLESFILDTYKLIFGLQFSVFLYLPLALSMTLSGYQIDEHRELYQNVENICNEYGVLMKVWDDYYEIFPPNKTETDITDTDIREGQFTWLFLMAKESSKSKDQISYLLDNYGRNNDESVKNIKELLEKIGIHDLYKNYRKQTYDDIMKEAKDRFEGNEEIQELVTWYFDRCSKYYSK